MPDPATPASPSQIESLRSRLEETDAEILRLRNLRAELAFQVGKARTAAAPPPAPAEVRPHPEHDSIFQEVQSARGDLEHPRRIAFLGPPATFTHLAVERSFGPQVRGLPCGTMAAVFRAVEQGRAEAGVVPVESATEGVVDSTLDHFLESDLRITAQIVLPASIALLGYPGLDLAGASRVYAHPKTLARCRRWLEERLPQALVVEVPSSAEAARMTLEDPAGAAVATEMAERIFGLDVLARDLQDPEADPARFLVLGHGQPEPSGDDQTTLLITVRDTPGALMALLAPLARRGLNLSRIENGRIHHHAGEQAIYLDLDGHAGEPALQDALEELKGHCLALKVLGSYPRAVPAG